MFISENKLKTLKEKRDENFKTINEYTKKLDNYSYELDDLKSENILNQSMLLNIIKRRHTKITLTPQSVELINNINNQDKFESQKREYIIYQEKKGKLLNKIFNCKSHISQLIKEQNENKILITQAQKEYRNLKKELLDYYHKILYEGIDTRKSGLSWVIKAIWDLGEEVNMNFLPDFLDNKGINFIFSITKKYIFLQKIRMQIEKFKNDSCKNLNIRKINKLKINSNEKNIFNTGLKNIEKGGEDDIILRILEYKNPSLIKIKDYIKMKKKSEKIQNNDYKNRSMNFPVPSKNNKNKITLKMLLDISNNNISNENISNEEDSLTSRKIECMDKFKKIKSWEKYIEKNIEQSKNDEIKRIWNEFLVNNYGKKYNIDIRIVISSLVGENDMIKEMEKQKSISNELTRIKKICAFYDTFENGKTNNSQQINFKKIKLKIS